MKNKLSSKKVWLSVLILVLILQSAALIYVMGRAESSWLSVNHIAQQNLGQMVRDNQISNYRDVVIGPKERRVYIPELEISLPLTGVSRSLMYTDYLSDPEEFSNEVSISTRSMVNRHFDMNKPETRSCTELVRVKVEDEANPYNPEEKVETPVKLADGRTLQMYSSAIKECDNKWPEEGHAEIVNLLQRAESY